MPADQVTSPSDETKAPGGWKHYFQKHNKTEDQPAQTAAPKREKTTFGKWTVGSGPFDDVNRQQKIQGREEDGYGRRPYGGLM